ncbi:unnamed protein product [Paramecium octaurelia]|uniref:Bystin n=1 Tax=Paramecium octaurelia TaxID=43137 RepID=A0A8S1XX06_PAROT|nr:unnamed protein product [Paramecium octaurelia]
MVIKKTAKKQRVLRTSQGVLKQSNKKVGFISATALTQQPGKLLRRLGEKKKGMRELRRIKRETQKQTRKPKDKQQEQLEEQEEVLELPNTFIIDSLKISPEDEQILSQFMVGNDTKTNQIIEDFQKGLQDDENKKHHENIMNNPKVVCVYENVAELMKTYRSGKLPQPFHLIPKLEHWKQVFELTKPQEWSPQAIFAATKIFSSALDRQQTEYLYSTVILPAIRLSIQEDKRLNVHLYNALIKAMYKPQAWFRSILFPLCLEKDFTLKEAQIIGSVIHKLHVPPIHGSIAIFKVAQLDFTGPVAVILKVLIEKKFSLPERALDEVIKYFMRYENDPREMPVIWHQMILRVCELYQLKSDHKDQLKKLISKKKHHLITKEIQKQLNKGTKMDVEK